MPSGFYIEAKYKNKVLKLNKALYGLKQSPRLWYNHLSNILIKQGFTVFLYDDGAFINKSLKITILSHVDDLIITGPNSTAISSIINNITKEIKL